MGFLQNLVQGGLNTFDKYDPVNSALFNGMIDVDSASVRETMNSSEHFWDDQEKKYAPGFLRGMAGGLRNNSQHWSEMAQKDNDNHARAITNAGLTFAALYGASGGWGTAADAGAEGAAGAELGADGYLAGGGYGVGAAGSLGSAATAFGKGYAGGSAGAAVSGGDQDTIFRSGVKGGVASAVGQGAGTYTGNPTLGGMVSGGTNAAMSGGSVLKGAATGGIGANSPDLSGDYVTNPGLKDAINKGVTQGGLAAMNGGNWKSAAVSGAVPGLFSYGANQMGFNDTTDTGYNMDPFQKAYGDSTGQSRAPWANDYSNGNFGIQPNYATQSSQTPWAYSGDGGYTGGEQGSASNPIKEALLKGLGYGRDAMTAMGGPKGMGDLASGLAGMYMGYRQQRGARDLMRGMDQRRNAYQEQLRSNLARKDALHGRRSDYGGRETQLQASLADLDSRNAPALMGLQGAQMGGLMGMFNSGLTTAQRFGAFNPAAPEPYQPNIPAPMTLPQMYQPQHQLDNFNWDRQRRPDQFGA